MYIRIHFTGIVSLFMVQLLPSEVICICEPGKTDSTNLCDGTYNCHDKSVVQNCSRSSFNNLNKKYSAENTEYWRRDSSGNDQKMLISRDNCFCRKKVDSNQIDSQRVECYAKEDLPEILGNKKENCQRGQDEFKDLIQIYLNDYIDENDEMVNKFIKIANYAAKSVGTCKDIDYTLDEFPSSYVDDKCPKNYVNCGSEGKNFCVRKPTLEHNKICSNNPTSENEISSHITHPSEWECLSTNQDKKNYICSGTNYQCLERTYNCSETTCYRSFSCVGNKVSEKISFSLENNQKFVFKLRINSNSFIRMIKDEDEKIEFKYAKRNVHVMAKNMKVKRFTTKGLTLNFVMKCTTCSSQVHLALDLNGTIPITSMYLNSKDFDSNIQLVYKLYSQNTLNVRDLINPTTRTSPIIFKHHSSSTEKMSHLKPMNDRKYMLKLGTNTYSSGYLSIVIPFDSNITFGNSNTEVLILKSSENKEQKLIYYDKHNERQFYSLFKKPEHIMILLEFQSSSESQLSFKTEDTVIGLRKLSTDKILESIIFTKEPISIQLNSSSSLDLHQISLYVLVPIIVVLGVSLFICAFILCCRCQKINNERRPSSIQVVNSNEYYGEASWSDVQMEVRYPNYYYAK